MRRTLNLFAVFTGVSAIQLLQPLAQPDYVAPDAVGYIYRSDNNGPGNLIQLGVPNYHQPQAFAAPLPLAQPPLQHSAPLHTYHQAAAPLVYVADKAIEDHDDDGDTDEEYEEHDDGLVGHGGHSFEKGGGSDYGEEHHNAHGEKGSKGYNSKGHHAKGGSGHYDKEHNEGFYHKGEGEKAGHHDEKDHHGSHKEAGESYKGGDHGHKKYHKKGEDITGYHKVFHKDEFKKDHDFYDVADNSGHFKKHGYSKSHHDSEEGGHKEGEKHDSGFDEDGFGKKGYLAKGHHDDSDLGHSAEEKHQNHHNHHEDYAKKGGKSEEKSYEFDDDDEYDEE
ncbi:hypothetical protein EVAR_31855_1 [Eumeta japonica]|uniref:Uncharacterized protein n=1 Tax=Eumeta variegata TaxID=151549 RepID=A0A4C1Z8W7_EUMVA|nr:hypothetical protein EVAR_31855_1 [Eumeta japonica]